MNLRISLLVLLMSIISINAQQKIPTVSNGKIERIENFESSYVTPRNVDIWLPDGYSTESRYAVLYMHDGQMLFDPESTWNKQAWNIDETASKLLESDSIQQFIIVGVWNGGKTRNSDYFPQKPFESLTEVEKDTVAGQLKNANIKVDALMKPKADNYLKFLVEELKPFVDSNYAVHTNMENTFVAGSSMGGLVSMYAICEYPEIFGGAACLSTHWIGTFTVKNNPLPKSFLKYLDANLPDPDSHKIYFDTGDRSLDSLYPEIQKKADEILANKGYNEENWMTRYFPGEDHSENAWSRRIHIPLGFLFSK